METTSDWLTVPTTEYAELVLASADCSTATRTLETLADPTNYTHVLDYR